MIILVSDPLVAESLRAKLELLEQKRSEARRALNRYAPLLRRSEQHEEFNAKFARDLVDAQLDYEQAMVELDAVLNAVGWEAAHAQ